jgi:hypothetical protein
MAQQHAEDIARRAETARQTWAINMQQRAQPNPQPRAQPLPPTHLSETERAQILSSGYFLSRHYRAAPEGKNEEKEGERCPICITNFEAGEHVIPLSCCKNKIHYNCFLLTKIQCIMCRGDMRKVSIHTHKHTHLPNLLYFQK